MPYLTDLADACRKSGLDVVEVPGWRTRGRGPMTSVETIVCHHTATSDRAAGDYPTMRVVRDGRPGLEGPLSQLGLGRSGTVYVIAAGRCSHAGKTALLRQGNSRAIGIECEASGARPIEGEQLAAYVRLVRALADHYGVPVSRVESHGEVAVPRGRKNDIRNDMNEFRLLVAGSKTGPGLSVGTPASAPRPAPAGLAVDGELGPATVRALQSFLAGQGFDFGPSGGIDGALGRFTISALQVFLARRGASLGRADGDFGPRSARALESYLGLPATEVGGWYPGLVRELQRFLNKGKTA